MEKIIKQLGLKDDATEEEIVAVIAKGQEKEKQLEKDNASLIETNKTLSASEAGLKVRADELEKQYKELAEKSEDKGDDKPKSDLEKLVEISN